MKRVLFLLLLVSMSADARAEPMASKALTSDVRLPDAIVTLAERNRALFENAATSDEAFCSFVADSLALLEPLDNALNSAPTPPAADDEGSGAYGAATAGAAVDYVEGGVHKRLQWKNVLSVASPASRPLVLAMKKLGGDSDFGAWIDQTTDYGGCHRPELALPALKSLSAGWATAPTCLRDAFRAEVVQTFTWMTEDRCFCAGPAERTKIQRQLAANARALSQMADIGAPFARKLRRLASQRDAHFGCNGPG